MSKQVKAVVLKGVDWLISGGIHDDSDVCVQCYQSLRNREYFFSNLHRESLKLKFCSQKCGHEYWQEYGLNVTGSSGGSSPGPPRVCTLPGCNKPCFKEGYKTHDYCGRSHARDHQAMLDVSRQGFGRHNSGSGHHNPSTFSGIGAGISSWLGFNRTGPVKFYNREDPYYEFTNFYEVSIRIDDRDWLTTEHYFQAQKFVGTPLVETIRMLSRPREAFDKSRDPRYSHWRRNDWESVKEDVMYKALQAKFSQHEKLRQLLLGTGERELIEHSPHDSYWGDGGNGTGKNRLGVLLLKLRKEMKAKKDIRPPTPPLPIQSQPQPFNNFNQQPYKSSLSNSSNSPNQPSSQRDKIQHDPNLAGQPCEPDSSSRPNISPPVVQASNVTVNAAMGSGVQSTISTNQAVTVAFTHSTTSVATTMPAAAAPSFVSTQSAGTMPLAQGQRVPSSTTRNLMGEYALNSAQLQRAPLGGHGAANPVTSPPPGFEHHVNTGQGPNGSQMYPLVASYPNVLSNLTAVRPQPQQPNAQPHYPVVSSVQATSPNSAPVQGSNYDRSPYRGNTPPYVTPSVPSSSIGSNYLPQDRAANVAGVHYSATSSPAAGPRHDEPSHESGCEPMDTAERNV